MGQTSRAEKPKQSQDTCRKLRGQMPAPHGLRPAQTREKGNLTRQVSIFAGRFFECFLNENMTRGSGG